MTDPVRDAYVLNTFGLDPASYDDMPAGASPGTLMEAPKKGAASAPRGATIAASAKGAGSAPGSGFGAAPGQVARAAPAPGGPTLSLYTLTVTPGRTTAPAGSAVQFEARGLYDDGMEQDETEAVEWSCSDPAAVTFDDAHKGRAQLGSAPGQVTITATAPFGQGAGSATLVIGPANQSTMSAEDQKAQADQAAAEEAARQKPKAWDGVEKCVALGHADGESGGNPRLELVRKLYPDEMDQKGLEFAYKRGFEEGQYARLEKLAGPIEVKGKASAASHAQLAYETGRREGRVGQATSRKEYEKAPLGWDIDPSVVVRAYDVGFKDGQAAAPHDTNGAYQMGLADGRVDDPIHRKDIAEVGDAELAKSYEAGFKHAKEMADQAWDEAAAKVDATTPAAPTDKPIMSTYDKVMTGAGVLSTLISVLEAKGLVARAGAGTTVAVLLLPVMAFKIGMDIGVAAEEKEEAIQTFKRQFSGLAVVEAIDRAKTLLKARKIELREPTTEGQAVIENMLVGWRTLMMERIGKELDGSPTKEVFITLHAQWVTAISKQLADMLANPRLHK